MVKDKEPVAGLLTYRRRAVVIFFSGTKLNLLVIIYGVRVLRQSEYFNRVTSREGQTPSVISWCLNMVHDMKSTCEVYHLEDLRDARGNENKLNVYLDRLEHLNRLEKINQDKNYYY